MDLWAEITWHNHASSCCSHEIVDLSVTEFSEGNGALLAQRAQSPLKHVAHDVLIRNRQAVNLQR